MDVPGDLRAAILDLIRRDGPITVARFMELALYDPSRGYYAGAARRSGRDGDFFTSVDAGPLFGTLLAGLVAIAWRTMGEPRPFRVIEVGASDGRLARDLMDALAASAPECHAATEVTLVERSAAARAVHASTLGPHADRLSSCADSMPEGVVGVVYANELLDAFPVHRVAMTRQGLVERYVGEEDGHLHLVDGPPSTPRLARYFDVAGVALGEGSVADISLDALDWCRAVGRALTRGYLVLVDYGMEAQRLYGGSSGAGTLRAYGGHRVDLPVAGRPRPGVTDWHEKAGCPPFLERPGQQDLTAHVDFTAVEAALCRQGLVRHAFVDQTHFLLGLGLLDHLQDALGTSLPDTRRRLGAQMLVAPEGIGSTHRVLLMATPEAPTLGFPFERPWTRAPLPL